MRKKTKQVNVRISDEADEIARCLMQRFGFSRADIIEWALRYLGESQGVPATSTVVIDEAQAAQFITDYQRKIVSIIEETKA
jgi:antitoxin component of RelBE/YafQ-DinJ toxin-antitoxin module